MCFSEKSFSKILKIIYRCIICPCPVHRKVEAVLVPLHCIGKITAIRTIRYDKHLNKFEQRIFAIKTLFGISMHLIECLADSDTASFQLDLYQWQTIYQYRHIIPISLCPSLLKLVDCLHFVSGYILLVGKIDILICPSSKTKS